MAPVWPNMVKDVSLDLLFCPRVVFVLPSFCFCFVFVLPLLCLCAFALPLLCLCAFVQTNILSTMSLEMHKYTDVGWAVYFSLN